MDPTLYFYISILWILLGAIVFVSLFVVTAPYGKFTTSQKKEPWYGFSLSSRAAWFIQEVVALIFAWMWALSGSEFTSKGIVALLLYSTHYFYRSIIYPLRLPSSNATQPNVFAVTVISAVFFNLMNTFEVFYPLFHFPGYLSDESSTNLLLQALGVALVALGWYGNRYHDEILRRLKERNLRKVESGEAASYYSIPYGGLYRFISAPNYFCELVEWIGFFIVFSHIGTLSFVIWVIANLMPRAVSSHAWYKDKFGKEFPKSRKAFIPFAF